MLFPRLSSVRMRKSLLGVGVVVLGIVSGWHLVVQTDPRRTPNWNGIPIPKEGLPIAPASWEQLGNPEYAVEDLRKVYAALDAFRKKHGRLPQLREILDWDGKHPGPGKLTKEDWTTPDMSLASSNNSPNDSAIEFNFRARRPDGSEKPAFPKAGEKDVWASSDVYVRIRQTVYRDRPETLSPVGTYVVLWSDGTIEKIPATSKLVYRESDRVYGHAFPGQAGLPKDTMRYVDFLHEKGGVDIRPK